MKYLCCLLLLLAAQFQIGKAQTQMMKSYLHGDWVLSHDYFSYDGCDLGETPLALEVESFTLVSFSAFNDSFLIRRGKEILRKGLYTLTFAPLYEHIPHCTEVVFIDLREDKNEKLAHSHHGDNWDYLILTPDMRIASKYYAPGMCGAWGYFSKIGWGFVNITCTTGHLRYMSNLIISRQQVHWVEKKKKQTEKR